MDKDKKNGVELALESFTKDFVVVGKSRVRNWHAWLAIGIAVGISAGILYVANRSGEFESGSAQVVPLAPTPITLSITPFSPASGPGDYVRKVPGWEGRNYDLHIPLSYKSTPIPIVVAFHGGGANSKSQIKLSCPGGDINHPKCLNKLADRGGFIVVYPNGTPNQFFLPSSRTWNATGGINDKYRCIGGTACSKNVDDVGYFKALLDDLPKIVSVDEKRIYVTGISNGGAMAHRLACELSDRIAAIAPVAAGNQYEAVWGCNAKRPVPVLEIHGLEDKQWPYEGGYGQPAFGNEPPIAEGEEYKKLMVPIHQSILNWAKRNGCAPDSKIESSGGVTKETYIGCKEGGDVTLYTIKASGHTWPQGYQYFSEDRVGKTSQEINANEVIWEFFQKHPNATKPSFVLLSPASGPVGTSITLTGTGFTSTGNIVLFGSGAIPNLTSSDGKTITFVLPTSLNYACYYSVPRCLMMLMPTFSVNAGTYQVSVKNANGTSNQITFTVTQPVASSITILSPNGGEIFARGGSMGINWSSFSANPTGCIPGTVCPPRVDITLWTPPCKPGTQCLVGQIQVATIASQIQDTGSFKWLVGGQFPDGKYVVKVSNGKYSDQSDSSFSILSPPTTQ